MGFTRDEVATLVEAFAERDEVAALELNVSCPNVESGLVMGADPGETAALVERVRPLTAKPLIVKLTPNASDPCAVARAAEAAGADAVSLINTLRGMALRAGIGRGPGWAEAPAGCRGRRSARSRWPRWRTWRARCEIPVVGMGGVQCGRHARDMLAAGATLVGVGTESFRDPAAGARIAPNWLPGRLGAQTTRRVV